MRKASHVLYRASLDFPPSTVFLVVVDYGVGTSRKAIVMKTKNDQYFVAPDNGVLTVVAEEYGVAEIREIENRELFYKKNPSFTFHGRDIFAPVAAHLDMGLPLESGRQTALVRGSQDEKACCRERESHRRSGDS